MNASIGTKHAVRAGGRWQPEERAGLLNRVFFIFCEGLLSLGSRKVLAADDLWDLKR